MLTIILLHRIEIAPLGEQLQAVARHDKKAIQRKTMVAVVAETFQSVSLHFPFSPFLFTFLSVCFSSLSFQSFFILR